jgi:hypothetical protein
MRKHSIPALQELDWELKAANPPYDSLDELIEEYGIGGMGGDYCEIEVVAPCLVVIDPVSVITGRKADVMLKLPVQLAASDVGLGYRIVTPDGRVQRGRVSTDSITWRTDGTSCIGSTVLNVPIGCVVDLIASYAGVAQHQKLVGDPHTVQNPLRAALEAFDPGLTTFLNAFDVAGSRGFDARTMETSVAWLLAMLGMRTIHLGNKKQTQDAMDIIAATPSHKIALIECTGAIPKDDKINLVVSRVERLRMTLVESGVNDPELIAVIVTNFPRREIRSILRSAAARGVLIVCKEDVARLIDRTLIRADPDAAYTEAQARLIRLQPQRERSPFEVLTADLRVSGLRSSVQY